MYFAHIYQGDALKTCRTQALLIKAPCQLEDLLRQIKFGDLALVATQGAPPFHAVLTTKSPVAFSPASEEEQKVCMLIVGPEGDFTDKELSALSDAGGRPVGLGANRLRVETAAIAMLAGAMLYTEGLG